MADNIRSIEYFRYGIVFFGYMIQMENLPLRISMSLFESATLPSSVSLLVYFPIYIDVHGSNLI